MRKVSTHMGVFGPFYERYVPKGYYPSIGFEEKMELLSGVDGITGLNVNYPNSKYLDEPDRLKRLFADFGLEVADMAVDLWTDKRWRNGSISASNVKTRKEAIKRIKIAIDLAKELKANSVLIWPAHDGFDYPFESDYLRTWENMLESLEEVGSYDPEMKLAVEYKQKDPRAKSLVDDVGKTLYLIKCLSVSNIGTALDLGHSFLAQENPAESMMLLYKIQKLYQIHLNDNYRDADPDMLFGSIHFWDTLEMFYYLAKIDFDGWMTIDICSPRTDIIKMLEIAVRFIQDYQKLAERLLEEREWIDQNLSNNRFADNMDLIRKMVFLGSESRPGQSSP